MIAKLVMIGRVPCESGRICWKIVAGETLERGLITLAASA